MNDKRKSAVIFELLRKLSVAFDYGVTQEKMDLYSKVLFRFDLKEIKAAIEKMILFEDNFRFPSLKKIIDYIIFDASLDFYIKKSTQNIINSTNKYGRYQRDKIKNDLNEFERKILVAFGGSAKILNSIQDTINLYRELERVSSITLHNETENRIELFAKTKKISADIFHD